MISIESVILVEAVLTTDGVQTREVRYLHGQVQEPAVIDSQHPQAGELAYPRGELTKGIARDVDLLE